MPYHQLRRAARILRAMMRLAGVEKQTNNIARKRPFH